MSEFVAAFTRASKLMRNAADAAMSRHGVRVGQNLVLEALWATDGQTPGELAEGLGVAIPTVVKMANRMEAAGLLTRRRDARDGRLVRLYLTERGRLVQNAIEHELAQLDRRATSLLTGAERSALQVALVKVAEGLSAPATRG